MAHFAQLNSNNHVTQVIVVGNDDITDGNGIESEIVGISFCQKHVGDFTTVWKQTSYTAGHTYACLKLTEYSLFRYFSEIF